MSDEKKVEPEPVCRCGHKQSQHGWEGDKGACHLCKCFQFQEKKEDKTNG